MVARRAFVVVVDGLRPDFIGAYGAACAETPFLDGFSSRSILFDFAFTPLPMIAGYCDASRDGQDTDDDGVCDRPIFLSDDPALLQQENTSPSSLHLAPSVDDPDITGWSSEFFRWAAGCINTTADGQDTNVARLTWIHASFRERPEVADLDKNVDSASLQELRNWYAGEVERLDESCEKLYDAMVDSCRDQQWMLIFMSARGYALGEHQHLGLSDRLFEEHVHVPLLIHCPNNADNVARIGTLCDVGIVHDLLHDWLSDSIEVSESAREWLYRRIAARNSDSNGEDVKLVFGPVQGTIGIRSRGWYLLAPSSATSQISNVEEQTESCQLFAKPDDRFEQNDVSDRCEEVVTELLQGAVTKDGPTSE